MIRSIEAGDFPFIYDLYMSPFSNPFLLYERMDEESFLPIFEELLQEGVLYIFTENDQNVGMFKLIRLKHRCSHIAYLGGLALAANHAGKGLGEQMLREIITFGKKLGLLRIELSVATSNTKAISLYEKVGFEKEGILKKYGYLKSENRFLDEFYMAYLY